MSSLEPKRRQSVRAIHLGDRINTSGYSGEILSAVPLAIRTGANGAAVVFRYGVVVLIGLTPDEESTFLEAISSRVLSRLGVAEEESAFV